MLASTRLYSLYAWFTSGHQSSSCKDACTDVIRIQTQNDFCCFPSVTFEPLHTHTHTTVLRLFFRDHPGEPVPHENFWTLWCKGRLTEADTPTIWLGATPSGLTSVHLHHPHVFLRAGCPSCHPTNSVKALKATSAFGLGRRRYRSKRCYMHRLRTMNCYL